MLTLGPAVDPYDYVPFQTFEWVLDSHAKANFLFRICPFFFNWVSFIRVTVRYCLFYSAYPLRGGFWGGFFCGVCGGGVFGLGSRTRFSKLALVSPYPLCLSQHFVHNSVRVLSLASLTP